VHYEESCLVCYFFCFKMCIGRNDIQFSSLILSKYALGGMMFSLLVLTTSVLGVMILSWLIVI
jgi:hypothetical protein